MFGGQGNILFEHVELPNEECFGRTIMEYSNVSIAENHETELSVEPNAAVQQVQPLNEEISDLVGIINLNDLTQAILVQPAQVHCDVANNDSLVVDKFAEKTHKKNRLVSKDEFALPLFPYHLQRRRPSCEFNQFLQPIDEGQENNEDEDKENISDNV